MDGWVRGWMSAWVRERERERERRGEGRGGGDSFVVKANFQLHCCFRTCCTSHRNQMLQNGVLSDSVVVFGLGVCVRYLHLFGLAFTVLPCVNRLVNIICTATAVVRT